MKAGLGWDDFERPDKDEFEKFIRVCKLLSHPSPVVMLNRKYAVAKLNDGGFGLVFAMEVTNSSGEIEERWFGTDIGLSEFSQLCQTASEEDILEAMANKVLNEVKLGKWQKS